MERDFLGLTSKHGASTTKLEDDAADNPNDPAVRGSGMQWSFSNKVSAVPQLLSFKASEEDSRTRKNNNNTTISAAANKDAYDSNHKSILGVIKTSSVSMVGTQAGKKHGNMGVYSMQHEEARAISVSNQSDQIIRIKSVLQCNAGHSFLSTACAGKPHSLRHGGGLSLNIAPLLPSKPSIVATTELRNSSKSSAKPTQLTIFYAGSVCVYEDISPEKAQAIMLLAGNGSSPIQSKAVPAPSTSTTTTTTRPSKLDHDGFIITQSYPSPLPTPLPMTFHAGAGSSSNINNNHNEIAVMRPLASSSAPTHSHLDSPELVASAKSAPPKMAPPVGLPQARKASLARFLEKRKERVTSTSPYYMSKKSPEGSIVGSDGISFSINSTTSCALPAIN